MIYIAVNLTCRKRERRSAELSVYTSWCNFPTHAQKDHNEKKDMKLLYESVQSFYEVSIMFSETLFCCCLGNVQFLNLYNKNEKLLTLQ